MELTASLSKGVFAFKKPELKKNKGLQVPFDTAQYWRLEEGNSDPDSRRITWENYQNTWSAVTDETENLLDRIHIKVFEDLVQYVKRVGYTDSFSSSGKDIPTACLVTGVNMPDHDSVFERLTKLLRADVTPLVARLSSSQCFNIKATINKMVHSFIVGDDDSTLADSDAEDDIPRSPRKKKKGLKKLQCNMTVLSAWYRETVVLGSDCTNPSPKKKLKKNSDVKSPSKPRNVKQRSPLVVIVEDVEGIPPHILQDLILICSEYRKKLPFVFILGVATTPAAIHRYLSQDATTSIAIETFQAQPSTVLLTEIIQKVLMSSLPFRLGGKVFKLLLDIFLFHGLSINNFIASLKFCMLEHFLRGTVSFLCCDAEMRSLVANNLSPSSLAALREVPSFITYVEGLTQHEKKLMEKDSHFKMVLLEKLKELDSWYETFCILVRCLHKLVHALPGAPLGKQLREIFSQCLSQRVAESEELQECWKILHLCGKEELMCKLSDIKDVLDEFPNNVTAVEVKEKLKIYSSHLHAIAGLTKDGTPVKAASTGSIPGFPTRSTTIELKPSDRFHLREKLLGSPKQKVKNPYEELRSDILSTFEHLFISVLKPPHAMTFHEVFFFDKIGSVKYQLLGSVRATITTGLRDPQKYLQCKCCKTEDPGNILTTMPDASICYKLHLECGRLINLYDWMQAFVATVGSEADVAPEKEKPVKKGRVQKKKKKVDEKLQARFIQAVSELQLLGFIRPTKRKTDHVQRLTWGGC